MNKLPVILFVAAMLWNSSTGVQCVQARDEVAISSDATTLSLSKSYGVMEVRKAIESVRQGNYAEAIPTLQNYATQGDLGATYVLGKLYIHGKGVSKSMDAATKLFTANAEGGHAPSMLALAEIKAPTSPSEALFLIKQAATAGNFGAKLQLGLAYENGALGAAKNPRLAFKYFQEASDAGYPVGHYHVARFYELGIGEVSANDVKSTRFYRKAALGGVAVANTIMAKRYFQGKGLEADPIAGIGWLTRGVQNGSGEAMVLLGERYELGDTMKQDLNRAGQLYSQAAKMGNPGGTYKLAMMYFNGTGTKRDPVRALVLLSGAKALPQAQQAMAMIKLELSAAQIAEAEEQIKKIESEKGKK